MARKTQEQKQAIHATARHYLAMTNNDPQAAWNAHIKHCLLHGIKINSIPIDLKDFVIMAEQNNAERKEREEFLAQCAAERLATGRLTVEAKPVETDAEYVNRLLAMPLEEMKAIYQKYKLTAYLCDVSELWMCHRAQSRDMGKTTVRKLREIIG